jgi:outer membrane protein TolC
LVSTNLESIPRAIDIPASVVDELTSSQDVQMAFQDNPDYRIRLRQAEQEQVRVRYTRNQRLPQLDAKASYGFNALGTNVSGAWDNIERAEYPAWSVGVEMRVPLGGGAKEKNEYLAAKLNHQKSLIAIQEAETQILNAIDAARYRVRASFENIASQQSVVQYNEKLLNTQLDKLSVGSIDSRTVLETEEKLFDARMAFVEILVVYRKSLLDLDLIRGSYLKMRNLEISPYQLTSRTEDYLRRLKTPKRVIEEFKQQAISDFEKEKK